MQNNGNEINPDFKVNQIIENSIDLHFEDSLEHAAQIINETEKRALFLYATNLLWLGKNLIQG